MHIILFTSCIHLWSLFLLTELLCTFWWGQSLELVFNGSELLLQGRHLIGNKGWDSCLVLMNHCTRFHMMVRLVTTTVTEKWLHHSAWEVLMGPDSPCRLFAAWREQEVALVTGLSGAPPPVSGPAWFYAERAAAPACSSSVPSAIMPCKSIHKAPFTRNRKKSNVANRLINCYFFVLFFNTWCCLLEWR